MGIMICYYKDFLMNQPLFHGMSQKGICCRHFLKDPPLIAWIHSDAITKKLLFNWLKPKSTKLPSEHSWFHGAGCFGRVDKLTSWQRFLFLKLAERCVWDVDVEMLMFGFSRLWLAFRCVKQPSFPGVYLQNSGFCGVISNWITFFSFRPSTFLLLPAWRPGEGCVGME